MVSVVTSGAFPYGQPSRPGFGAAPTFSLDFPSSIQIGSSTVPVRMPDLPAFSAPELSLGQYQAAIDKFTGGVAGEVKQLIGGQAGPMLAQFAAAAGPYGPAVALGLKVGGSLVSGLFGGEAEPPKPNVAGVNIEELVQAPLSNTNRAVLAGKIVGGQVQAGQGAKDGIRQNSFAALDGALLALATGASQAQAGEALKARGATWRTACYFAYYVGYKDLFASRDNSLNSTRIQAGKMLKYAAPRVAVRELLWNWYCYRLAYAAFVATLGNPASRVIPLGMTFKHDALRPAGATATANMPLGSGFSPTLRPRGEDWPKTRKLAQAGAGGYSGWLAQIEKYAIPAPKGEDDGTLVYNPIPQDILREEAASYDRRDLAAIRDVALPGMNLTEVGMPSSDELTDFPETYTQAAALAQMLAATTKNGIARAANAKAALALIADERKADEQARLAAHSVTILLKPKDAEKAKKASRDWGRVAAAAKRRRNKIEQRQRALSASTSARSGTASKVAAAATVAYLLSLIG